MTDVPRRVGALPDEAPDLTPFTPEERRGAPVIDDLNAALDKALSADVTFEPITLEVPKRPGMSVRFSTDIDDDKMNGWTKRTEDKRKPDGKDSLRYVCLIVATQCEAFLMGGKEVHDEGGGNYTFGHRAMRDRYSTERAADVVRKIYAADPHVYLVANAILEASGWGDKVVEVEGEAELLTFLAADTRVKAAARVGRAFGIDPMVVLAAHPREWAIRVAAYNVVLADEKKAAEK